MVFGIYSIRDVMMISKGNVEEKNRKFPAHDGKEI